MLLRLYLLHVHVGARVMGTRFRRAVRRSLAPPSRPGPPPCVIIGSRGRLACPLTFGQVETIVDPEGWIDQAVEEAIELVLCHHCCIVVVLNCVAREGS